MKFIQLFNLIFCLLCSSIIIGQETLLTTELSDTIQSDTNQITSNIEFDKSKVLFDDFNQGIISDPFLLLQGKVAGLQVYNRGGDPNVQSLARIRGISSLDQDIQPLIVIDGIPNTSIENIDPNDIESIEVLKDGFARAQYGARGANGVIVITSKKSESTSKLGINYIGNFGISGITNGIQVLSPAEFIANGGNDLQSESDFLSEITRSGISHAHGLSISNGFKNYNFRVSGNYRNSQGILKESGFQKYNGSAHLAFNLFDDKLSLDFSGWASKKDQNLSFSEAFHYAVSNNPTTPIFAEDSPFPINEDRYGGYFESVGLFAAFNPIALIDLNTRKNQITSSQFSSNLCYDIWRGIKIGMSYAKFNTESKFDEFGSPESIYRSYGNSLDDIKVRGFWSENTTERSYSDIFISYIDTFGLYSFKTKGGYTYQGFINDYIEFDYLWPDRSNITGLQSRRYTQSLVSFYNQIEIIRDEKLYLNFGLRYEGSNELPSDNKWIYYPSVQVAYDFGGMTYSKKDHLFLTSGFGVTRSKIDDQYDPNATWAPFQIDKNEEFDLGINFQNNTFLINATYFSKKAKNVNFGDLVFSNGLYGNISTKGIDLELGVRVLDKPHLKYDSKILLSTYSSVVAELDWESLTYGSPGPPGFGSASLLRIAEGEEFGQIYAPVFEGIDSDGFTIYKDVNNDGMINVFTSQDEDSDYTDVGNAIPDFELSWQHNLKISCFDLSVLFRGAFGHSLINLNRMFYENNPLSAANYNSVKTSKAIEGLREARYSSLYVEDASFVKLDNLAISRSFQVGPKRRNLQLSLIGQNLLTITGYTGSDPEPSFYDMGGSGYFSPGIDRRASYRPSRTISIGVKFDLH
jgi:iron complex outermembrane receptor protein